MVAAQVATPKYDGLKYQTDGHGGKEYDEGHSNQEAGQTTIGVLTTTTTSTLTYSRPEEETSKTSFINDQPR